MGRRPLSREDSSVSAESSTCVLRYGSSLPLAVMLTAFTFGSCESVSVMQ